MRCPGCGGELVAVGGVPTVWTCERCTEAVRDESNLDVKYLGDTAVGLRRIQ